MSDSLQTHPYERTADKHAMANVGGKPTYMTAAGERLHHWRERFDRVRRQQCEWLWYNHSHWPAQYTHPASRTGACGYHRPCAHHIGTIVGKSQSCMVFKWPIHSTRIAQNPLNRPGDYLRDTVPFFVPQVRACYSHGTMRAELIGHF